MGSSGVRNQSLVIGSGGDYLIDCQHITTQRDDGVDPEQDSCVLWRFKEGKIVEGRHFAADERALEQFFNHAMGRGNQTADERR